MKVAITGADGFVGTNLVNWLLRECPDVELRLLSRTLPVWARQTSLDWRVVHDLISTDWQRALSDIDVVIHLAAKAHARGVPLGEVDRVNVRGATSVMKGACSAGVRKFVFLSSVKAQATVCLDGCLRENQTPTPRDVYGRAKLEAERLLEEVASTSSCDLAIIRSPLVYGPGVKGNFLMLIRAVKGRWPLPFGSIDNRRSFISVRNLAAALWAVADSQAQGVFLVSDESDISTPDLVRVLGHQMSRPPRLFPAPKMVIRAALTMVVGREAAESVLEDLYVCTDKIRREIGWTAPYGVESEIRMTVNLDL